MEEQENSGSIKEYLLNNESQVSDSTTLDVPKIKWIPLFIGIAVFVLGLVDMIIFYLIPIENIKNNEIKYPNAIFSPPNKLIITVHFVLHASVMIFGAVLILIGFKSFINSLERISYFGLIIAPSLIVVCWIVEVFLGFSLTQDPPINKSIEQMKPYLIDEQQGSFAFIYSNDEVVVPNCYINQKTGAYECTYNVETCYSQEGIMIPISSEITSESYDFRDSPKIFNFVVEKVVNMSYEYEVIFRNIMWNVDSCDEGKKVVDYYPLVAGTYLIASELPSWLSHKVRVLSVLFGVSIYYELNMKSIPSINYKQHVNVDIVPNFNYDSLWTDATCFIYGQCRAYNPKPTPNEL
ncbi:hypothetical protein M9Y10_023888 [Tritrichomonas musculus]|uniref:Uncharacterized protein n=1 Tax=Tritrichomonas musculus TaxID=1915356 RepID=A0ABR2KWF6_9EUKA